MNSPSAFQIDAERGFLPAPDPLAELPQYYEPWEDVARELPKLLVARKVRQVVSRLPLLETARLTGDRERRRAMLILSFLGHAYVWGESQTVDRIPAPLAVPWFEVARQLGRPPVLSYASYALDNWRRIDPEGPIALGNIALLQNFHGGLDEEWFILVHVAIEARAGAALAGIVHAQAAVKRGDAGDLARDLRAIARTLEEVHSILLRMPEHCDPYIYYHRVRPYLHGWANHPALPQGLVYEGVEAYGGRPQKFRGETGAQSSLVPSIDAALGIAHKEDLLQTYLMEMRDYMPPAHRAFVEFVERGPSIRRFVLDHKTSHPSLREAYNACIHWLELFRSVHLEYAQTYIHKQNQRGPKNPVDVGTGGTPFIPYLRKHRDETNKHRIT
ncbi:MAG TPA: indoleamine 2,3-dioxygenase [Candidatus Acidoferrales bacterium]|nr:indoleamine 2,3-dioxygenase [Candidatus Acidoferrales bacterium]